MRLNRISQVDYLVSFSWREATWCEGRGCGLRLWALTAVTKHAIPNSLVVFTLSPSSQAVHTSSTCGVPALLSVNPFYLNFGEWPPLFDTLPFFDRTNAISGI